MSKRRGTPRHAPSGSDGTATETNGDSGMTFVTPRRKPLAEVTGEDVPPGLDPEDVATDCPERPWR